MLCVIDGCNVENHQDVYIYLRMKQPETERNKDGDDINFIIDIRKKTKKKRLGRFRNWYPYASSGTHIR
jgi:hypothetical protein